MQRLFQPINQLLRTINQETSDSIARKIRDNFKASLKKNIAAKNPKYGDVLHSLTASLNIIHWDEFKSSLHAWIDQSFINKFNSCDPNQQKIILTDINNKLLEVAGIDKNPRLSIQNKRGVYHRHHQYHTSTVVYLLPDAMYNNELHRALNQIKDSINNNNPIAAEPGVSTKLI